MCNVRMCNVRIATEFFKCRTWGAPLYHRFINMTLALELFTSVHIFTFLADNTLPTSQTFAFETINEITAGAMLTRVRVAIVVICNIGKAMIWAATWQNQQHHCAPSENSDQPGHPPVETLIRLSGCPGWSESPLGAHSFCWFCHAAAHFFLDWKRDQHYRHQTWVNEWQNHVWSLLLHKIKGNTPKIEKMLAHFILQPYNHFLTRARFL